MQMTSQRWTLERGILEHVFLCLRLWLWLGNVRSSSSRLRKGMTTTMMMMMMHERGLSWTEALSLCTIVC